MSGRALRWTSDRGMKGPAEPRVLLQLPHWLRTRATDKEVELRAVQIVLLL